MENKAFRDAIDRSSGSTLKYRKELERLYSSSVETKSVLGVDLYQYSQMEKLKQFVVPSLIREVFDLTHNNLAQTEQLFFTKAELDEIGSNKIDTGDGFYVILDNPIKATVYLIVFATTLQTVHTRRQAAILGDTFSDFVFRYTITTGDLFQYENKYYGDALIRCARIISLDKLNRFLMDRQSYHWFLENAEGFETMRLHKNADLVKYKNAKLHTDKKSVTFPDESLDPTLETVIVQKIGMKTAKTDEVDIYSLYVQAKLSYRFEGTESDFLMIVSIGNLNVSGI